MREDKGGDMGSVTRAFWCTMQGLAPISPDVAGREGMRSKKACAAGVTASRGGVSGGGLARTSVKPVAIGSRT